MVSVDIVFVQKALRYGHMFWSFPLQLAVSVFFLYQIMGISVFQGEVTKGRLSQPGQCALNQFLHLLIKDLLPSS